MDEPTQTQNDEAVEVGSPQESSTSEPITSVETVETEGQPQAPTAEAPAETTPVETERQPRPAERRIQELVQQNKALKDQIATVPLPVPPPQAPKLSDLVQGREQLMPDELDSLGQKVYEQGAQAAGSRASLEVQQLRNEMVMKDAINETEKEAAKLENEYPELNETNNAYNPILEKKIVERYQREAVHPSPSNPNLKVLDPRVKLSEIAREEVEFLRAATENGRAQASATLSSQADRAALTPTSTQPEPDKGFDQMSLSEQEEYLRAQGRDI